MDESKEYSVAFKASGRVTVPARCEEEARSRALDDVIIPGMWHEDFPEVTIESVEVVGEGARRA